MSQLIVIEIMRIRFAYLHVNLHKIKCYYVVLFPPTPIELNKNTKVFCFFNIKITVRYNITSSYIFTCYWSHSNHVGTLCWTILSSNNTPDIKWYQFRSIEAQFFVTCMTRVSPSWRVASMVLTHFMKHLLSGSYTIIATGYHYLRFSVHLQFFFYSLPIVLDFSLMLYIIFYDKYFKIKQL